MVFALQSHVRAVEVCLISKPDLWGHDIAKMLASHEFFKLHHLSQSNQFQSIRHRYDVIILRVSPFTTSHMPLIYRLRVCHQRTGLVITSDRTDAGTLLRLKNYSRTTFVNMLTEIHDLNSVVMKTHLGETTGPRKHQRTALRQTAMLRDTTGYTFRGEILDISQMGAKCRIKSSHVKKQGLVKLIVNDQGSMKTIEASVAWEQKIQGLHGRDQLIGLQFLAVA